ncbi:MAG: CheR family methyltransferase [Pseudobdellovibrionaceae bacterium]
MSLAFKKPAFEVPVINDDFDLPRKDFDFFAKKMFELSGVNLPFSSKNEALVKNRMSKLMRRLKVTDIDELRNVVESEDRKVIQEFISALTTNKTHFFREEAHFDFLKNYLKGHFQKPQDLRIWCAAASTGQEPYTLAICVQEALNPSQLARTKILATDIDLQVLQKATNGIYTESEMEGLPGYLQKKYFHRLEGKQKVWQANDELNKMIRFAPFNLVHNDHKFQTQFHLIFCRNVLIYFDPPTTAQVIDFLADQLSPEGYLILGHSESGAMKCPKVKPLARAVYQKIVGSK